ncbi:MAG: branched-chain amino acid ABC transporter substrate-binding protein, partial [Acidobacteria bacterium]
MKSPRFAILVGVAAGAMLLISNTQLLRAQVQGAWTLTGNMSAARELGAQATLNDGNILVAGGTDGTNVLSSAEVYSPSSGEWTPTGSMAEARKSFPSVTLPDGRVLVTGGLDGSGSVL